MGKRNVKSKVSYFKTTLVNIYHIIYSQSRLLPACPLSMRAIKIDLQVVNIYNNFTVAVFYFLYKKKLRPSSICDVLSLSAVRLSCETYARTIRIVDAPRRLLSPWWMSRITYWIRWSRSTAGQVSNHIKLVSVDRRRHVRSSVTWHQSWDYRRTRVAKSMAYPLCSNFAACLLARSSNLAPSRGI